MHRVSFFFFFTFSIHIKGRETQSCCCWCCWVIYKSHSVQWGVEIKVDVEDDEFDEVEGVCWCWWWGEYVVGVSRVLCIVVGESVSGKPVKSSVGSGGGGGWGTATRSCQYCSPYKGAGGGAATMLVGWGVPAAGAWNSIGWWCGWCCWSVWFCCCCVAVRGIECSVLSISRISSARWAATKVDACCLSKDTERCSDPSRTWELSFSTQFK